jgi:hypothetical protein
MKRKQRHLHEVENEGEEKEEKKEIISIKKRKIDKSLCCSKCKNTKFQAICVFDGCNERHCLWCNINDYHECYECGIFCRQHKNFLFTDTDARTNDECGFCYLKRWFDQDHWQSTSNTQTIMKIFEEQFGLTKEMMKEGFHQYWTPTMKNKKKWETRIVVKSNEIKKK